MNTIHRDRNLAARMGRWSADHWKTATFGWLAFVLAAFALGGLVGTTMIDTNKPGPGESGRMDRLLNKDFKTRIIISDATRAALKGRYDIRPLGEVTVKGKSRPVAIYEVKQ